MAEYTILVVLVIISSCYRVAMKGSITFRIVMLVNEMMIHHFTTLPSVIPPLALNAAGTARPALVVKVSLVINILNSCSCY